MGAPISNAGAPAHLPPRPQPQKLRFLLLAALLALAAAAPAAPLDGEELAAALDAAEDAEDAKEAAPAAVVAQLTSVDPPAALRSGTGDLSTTGPCEAELDDACSDVRPGEGRLAECLLSALAGAAAGAPRPGGGAPVVASDACRDDLLAFAEERSENANADVALADACAPDIETLCADVSDAETVLGCLRDVEQDLAPACAAVVARRRADAAVAWTADAELAAACEADVATLCAAEDANGPAGAVGACLRAAPGRLSWECRDEVFRQDVENAGDVRLSASLFKACLPDKKRFCASVPPGHGAAQACLEASRAKPSFSAACRSSLDAVLARRAADFRLDPDLRTACAADAETLCGLELDEVEGEGADAAATGDAPVLTCLQDYRDELASPDCAAAVHASLARAASDIRFDSPLAAACAGDRTRLCASVPPGSAAVIRCLQDSRSKLTPDCGAVLFDSEVRMAESIDFQAPLATACAGELKTLCPDVPHTAAAALRCLQDVSLENKAGMSPACGEAVAAGVRRAATDYRLNFRLAAACAPAVASLCAGACAPAGGPPMREGEPCGGTVLRCLQDKVEDIKEPECAAEVEYFVRMEVHDFRNDVLLAEACRGDVERACAGVAPGEGRVHACLRDHRAALAPACASEVAALEAATASNVDLQPSLAAACAAERAAHCPGVAAGKARVLACLVAAADGADFGAPCVERLTSALAVRGRDWKLDRPLRAACAGDARACAPAALAAKGGAHRCLAAAAAAGALSRGCRPELARSARAALQFYARGAPITAVCDADAEQRCAGAAGVGAVRACLASALPAADDEAAAAAAEDETLPGEPPARRRLTAEDSLAPACAALVAAAEPRASFAAFESSLSLATLAATAASVEARLGLKAGTLTPAARRGASPAAALTLSGWTAVAGVVAMVALVLAGVVYAVAVKRGFHKGYTRVVKERKPRGLPTTAGSPRR